MSALLDLAERCERATGPDRELDALHDDSNRRLLSMLPAEQLDRVLGSHQCDIEPDFLGFVGIYDRLAQIVPRSWTVVDLGCAYAPQAFFFATHAAYIGVDLLTPLDARFVAPNSQHLHMPIADFVEQHSAKLHQGTTFAICSYVPPWHGNNIKLVREAFSNVFRFYPCSGGGPLLPARAAQSGEG